MNTSTTDTHSRDNISSEITIGKKSDYKDQKPKTYKYDTNHYPNYRYNEETIIPVIN